MAHGNRNPKPGDLIEIKRSRLYQHWALYVGDGYVVHVTDGDGSLSSSGSTVFILNKNAKVKKQLLKDVVGNDAWVVNNKYDCFWEPLPVKEIIRRAEEWIDQKVTYHVICRNCEHFVTKLRYGVGITHQVLNIIFRGAAEEFVRDLFGL